MQDADRRIRWPACRKRWKSCSELPGVARKTANVVLGVAFGIAAGIVVDTHVSRLSQRLGLTKQKDAGKIEQDLMKLVPRKDWIIFSHLVDLPRSPGLQSAPAVVRRVCGGKTLSFVDVEDGEGSEVGRA